MTGKTGNKRAAQGDGCIRHRSDGRWEGIYTLESADGISTPKKKSVYAKTQAECRRKLREATEAIANGTFVEQQPDITLSKWADVWMRECAGDVKLSTIATYAQQIRKHILPYLGATKLTALKTLQIQRFYASLTTDKKLSPYSVKSVHAVLHRVLSQAVDMGFLKTNPSDACKLPRIMSKEIEPFDEDVTRRFLQAIRGHQYEKLYTVDLFTGLRESEILGLTWDCIDFENCTIRIYRQLQILPQHTREGVVGDRAYCFSSPKSNKPRIIHVAPYVIGVLRERKMEQDAERLNAGTSWDEGAFPNLVFTDKFGSHMYHISVYCAYKKIVKALGIPSARFHDLRHSYAVASIYSGGDIKTLQENLGHATSSFTLDKYGHVTKDMQRAGAQRMETYIETLGVRVCECDVGHDTRLTERPDRPKP